MSTSIGKLLPFPHAGSSSSQHLFVSHNRDLQLVARKATFTQFCLEVNVYDTVKNDASFTTDYFLSAIDNQMYRVHLSHKDTVRKKQSEVPLNRTNTYLEKKSYEFNWQLSQNPVNALQILSVFCDCL